MGNKSALKLGKASGAWRRPGKKGTEEDEGHSYSREPTHKETSGVKESTGLLQESEKANGSFLHSLETQVLEGMAGLDEKSPIQRVRETSQVSVEALFISLYYPLLLKSVVL